jgi:ATP/maltotriose-dependent transcriptional regulator MalT
MRCASCRTESREGTQFCQQCGAALDAGDGVANPSADANALELHWAKGNQDLALDHGQRCLEMGRFQECLQSARELIALLEGPRERERFGLSPLPYVGACGMAAWSLAELGDDAGALEFVDRGRRVAAAADHLYSRIVVDVCHGYLLAYHGDAAEAVTILEPAVATCRDKSFVGWLMLALAPLACAHARLGRGRDGIPLAREAITLQEKTGAEVNRSYLHLALARTAAIAGELGEAEASARRGLEFAERHQEQGWEAWLRWLLGELAARRGDAREAERCYDAAQDIAETLGMRPLVERCRLALRQLV